ncbi:hypothetical protein JOM56_008232 [Amanita muscaria]
MKQITIVQMKVREIPHQECLVPLSTPPGATLMFSMLLKSAGISNPGCETVSDCRAQEEDNRIASLCDDCLTKLQSKKTPPLSLADGMWIGEVPLCLSILTLPEQILIAKYYVAAFMVKLYPKQLDPSQVANMVDGKTLPPPPKILTAMIAVTFVTPKGHPEPSMPDMFQVCMDCVRAALHWLKENNALYMDIIILEENLNTLPVDGILRELAATTKISHDVDVVESEHSGYMPSEEDIGKLPPNEELHLRMAEAGLYSVEDEQNQVQDQGARMFAVPVPKPSETTNSNHKPTVLPLHSHMVVDVDSTHIPNSDLMAHALLNTAQKDDSFLFKRGSEFVNEYPRIDCTTGKRAPGGPNNPNHLLGSFPVLFPYGLGGFETERQTTVPYETHIKWALRYHDQRFRKCLPVIFLVFSVCQKRQVCRSAVLQISRTTYCKNKYLIDLLKPEDLVQASDEERRGVPFSNPTIQLLRRHLRAICMRIAGSDKSRFSACSKIWGTTVAYGPPSLWVALNPPETQDPIAQVLTGQDIDLDNLAKLDTINANQRAINLAEDPFAAAEYFHFMMRTMLEVVFGIKAVNGRVEREIGTCRKIQAYVGMVEAQG